MLALQNLLQNILLSHKSTKSNLEFTLSLYRAITVLHRIIKCLNRIMHSNMDLHRVYTNEFWVFTASTYCGIGGARCNPSPWEDKIGEKPVLLYIGFVQTLTVVCIRESQLLLYVLKSLTLVSILEDRHTMTFYSSELHFGIDGSFKIRYSMNFYLTWHRNYKRSK